jgi:hypothetical protein
LLGSLRLALPFAESDHAHPALGKNADKLQADRAASNYDHGIALSHLSLFHAAQHASQRFDQGSILERNVVWNDQHILPNNPGWDPDVFGISAVIEQQVFT